MTVDGHAAALARSHPPSRPRQQDNGSNRQCPRQQVEQDVHWVEDAVRQKPLDALVQHPQHRRRYDSEQGRQGNTPALAGPLGQRS